jgi:hypothetical protein
MENIERDGPAANRVDSEVEFLLRRAKWRRGPDVLRDVSRARAAIEDAKAEPALRKRPRKTGV